MFDLDSCVCFITNKVSKKLADTLNKRLIMAGSTRAQWLVMYNLEKYQKLSQTELADKLDLKTSTVARLLDRMEKDEIIQRIKGNTDRRVTYIILTDKGKKRVEDLLPVVQEMSILFSQGISDEEFEIFNKVLNKLCKNGEIG
ncbi:MarR family transcriptional regulator [Mycoplasmatota bacterium]|nr:MarR family transcriptional regulator [Mycoplasmatota bacterium]